MTGYVRVDTGNNIADGNVISAADLDNEFDGIQAAFNANTGHNHDGTTGEGAPILVLGPTQDVVVGASAVTPKTTNTVDIGSSSLKFKDLYMAGNASIGGTLGVTGATTLSAALTYGGVTLSNAVTGTGNMVLSASPTLTGTLSGANASLSGTLAVTGVATLTAQPILSSLTASRAVFTDGSKGLVSNAITGTGNVVMSASPTLTGTITAEALTTSSTVTLSGGTANGVAYLNGSKVLTTGSALTFDGTGLSVTGTTSATLKLNGRASDNASSANFFDNIGTTRYGFFYFDPSNAQIATTNATPLAFLVNNTEQMRLTSTGLGIGTSSPTANLSVGDDSTASSRQISLHGPASGTNGGASINIRNGANTVFALGNASNVIGGSYTSDAMLFWGNAALRFYGNGAERMRLDSSGNLGLGVTPSASTLPTIQSAYGVLSGNTNISIVRNAYYNGGWKYTATGAATFYQHDGGGHYWYNAPSGTAGNAISFTQAMTLDASGNLGVGLTNPSSFAKAAFVSSSGTNALYAGTGTQGLFISADNASRYVTYAASGSLGGGHIWNVGNTEAARIDLSGNLLVGTTSGFAKVNFTASSQTNLNLVTTGVAWSVINNQGNAGTQYFSRFDYSGTQIGSITGNNTATAYTTSSDYRLKENIAPMTGALAKVAALKPVTYTWKADGSAGEGFIAHELAEVCPAAVTGEKDAVDADGKPQYQGIDVSFLVGTLTAAIQEQQAIIEDMKTRLAAAGI